MTIHVNPAENTVQFSNRLKSVRTEKRFSQIELATRAGITRQAVSAIESNLYLPTTAVALRLASVLACRVEDLFSLTPSEDVVKGTLVGSSPQPDGDRQPIRVKVCAVGKRMIVRPVSGLGEQLSFTVPADGYITGTSDTQPGAPVEVTLARDRTTIQHEISVAGCDPSIVLAGAHLRRQKDRTSVVGWTMGSMTALHALQRGEVHVAGLHLYDPVTGESNMPILRRMLGRSGHEVVTFATWEEGLIVQAGNPLSLRAVADLADPKIRLINREEGSGARLLLDQQLQTSGIDPTLIHGYDHIVASHTDVAKRIAQRQADAGIGIRSAARLFGLDFVPLQTARYDLVVPKAYLKFHPTLTHLFETLVSRPFLEEIASLGGYDTSETGKVQALHVA